MSNGYEEGSRGACTKPLLFFFSSSREYPAALSFSLLLHLRLPPPPLPPPIQRSSFCAETKGGWVPRLLGVAWHWGPPPGPVSQGVRVLPFLFLFFPGIADSQESSRRSRPRPNEQSRPASVRRADGHASTDSKRRAGCAGFVI